MRYLIDTHIFIWIFSEPEKIKPRIRAILDASDSQIFLSPIIFYEIELKKMLGKLTFTPDLREIIAERYFEIVNINFEHTLATHDLPLLHRDPFDRILIAQSIVEGIPLITPDKQIHQYDFNFIPA